MERVAWPAADQPRPARLARLASFLLERYPPATYGTLIAALVLCGTAGAAIDRGEPIRLDWSQAGAAIAAWLAFLQLRALDEMRDEATDRLARPDRPLPRGLVSRTELRGLAVGAAIVGLAIAAAVGPAALGWYGLAIGQVWLLDLAGDRQPAVLRGMVATALLHSGIVPTVLLVAWAAAAAPGASVPVSATLLLVWGAGLALEFGRKTRSADEERPGLATYSAALGRARALGLVAMCLAVVGAGAALLALAVGAPPPVAALPFGLGAVACAALVLGGGRVGTGTLSTVVPLAVLAALLWPAVLAWGLG
jgi:4-hydroxybenzoate polyprenyltransferase